MIRVVADDKIPFIKGALDKVAEISYLPGGSIAASDLDGTDALLIRTRTRCDKKLLDGSGVSFIASATIGHDHIDAEYCRKKGITWTNAPGCNSASVQQYMVSTLLWLAVNRGLDLHGSTLGVVGAGNVGSKVAAAAGALGMRVLINDPPRERAEGPEGFVSLGTILEESDVISLHVPLNAEGPDKTFHLVDRDFIGRAKKGFVLINTSRGPVVESQALLEALHKGRAGLAVLDVFEGEPDLDPGLHAALTLATPHIAGYSLDGKAMGTAMSVQSLSRHFSLGLDDWIPGGIPEPDQPVIFGDAGSVGWVELLWEIYRQTYDVSLDDNRLREQPELFETLRGDYPFRREPGAYRVKLFQPYEELNTILQKLGFELLSDYCM